MLFRSVKYAEEGKFDKACEKAMKQIEDAGYAGGIVSAAIDGIIVAEQVFQKGR